MAVQAQHPNPSYNLSKDFRAHLSVAEELRLLQEQQQLQILLETDVLKHCNNSNVAAGFSDHQRSELTCNVSGTRKRSREETSMALPQQNNNGSTGTDQQGFPLPSHALRYPNLSIPFANCAPVFGSAEQPMDSRLLETARTSTSGRPAAVSSSSSPLAHGFLSQLYQQSAEIDALVRFQSERLRTGLDAARKRHCRAILSVLEAQVAHRLKEKETELENAHRRNAELEEKIRQMAAENHVWFNVAKNNEAIACCLRSSIEQVLQNSAVNGPGPVMEGYGDSGDAPFPADDTQSCCFEKDVAGSAAPADGSRRRNACKACGHQDVCVLLLPCRHLCLCRNCESKVDACPVCHSARNASLQVYMS